MRIAEVEKTGEFGVSFSFVIVDLRGEKNCTWLLELFMFGCVECLKHQKRMLKNLSFQHIFALDMDLDASFCNGVIMNRLYGCFHLMETG